MNAEVALILEHKLTASQASGTQPKNVFLKSYEYVNRVKRFKDKEAVTQVRQCVPALRHYAFLTYLSHTAPHPPPPPPPPPPPRLRGGLSARPWLGRDLERKALHEFEVAQLGNLLPDSADEAKSLIPSLESANITSEQLSEALDQLRSYRQYN